mgnify:CR=1 FL=1
MFKVQPKLIPKPSLNVSNATAVMSTRINDIVIKLRSQSRDSYLEGCDELNVLIYENNNCKKKEQAKLLHLLCFFK